MSVVPLCRYGFVRRGSDGVVTGEDPTILAIITPRVRVVGTRQTSVICGPAGVGNEEIGYAAEMNPPDIEREYLAPFALFKNASRL